MRVRRVGDSSLAGAADASRRVTPANTGLEERNLTYRRRSVRDMRRSLVVAFMILASSCGGPKDDPADPADPAYPGSTILTPTRSGGTCCFYPDDSEARCPVLITDYGTNDEFDRVIDFYDGLGFDGEGAGPTGGPIVRWIGVRNGNPTTWRKVDLGADGVGGHPEWATFVEVLAPDCP
jgi:hypothetical protein